MNHIYRIVWNYSAACWQAVSEIGKGKHKVKASQSAKADKTNVGKMRASSLPAQIVSRIRPLALLVSLVSAGVLAAPTGGKVSVGQAEISQQGSVTHIHQASHSAAINWQNFNVKPQETVNFHQPSRESVTLNRVIGNERAVIEGAINAPGNVFISNPNGVLIGNGAQINVGSLVATTAQIRDEDFIKGNYQFAGKGNGKIENLSNITVPKGGVVALIAPIVKNQGKIHATDGQVLLASAQAFRISLPNEQFQYTVKQGVLQGLVENGGAILAPNGRVVLTAKGISAVKKSVIKHSGVIEANRVRNQGGVVELLGDLDHSELHLTGEIKAEGKGKADGGSVETSAAKLNIGHNAKVSTQSAQGKTGNWVLDPKDFTVAKSGGDITGAQVAQHLKSSNLELKSRSGAKEGKGDVIINDSISWQQNTLTLNADNDVRINKTLNGEGSAKLALKVGQSTADGGGADFLLEDGVKMDKRTVRINLPVGQNFSLQRGSAGKVETFEVLHDLPKDGYFRARNIAIGKDIDLANRGALPFSGWSFFLTEKQQKEGYSHFYGLGHHINNLTINSGGYHSGLLKYLGNGGGEIRDLKLHNANVIGSSSGILVSLATTTIKNIYTQGSVSGDAEAGGIAGSINGNLINVMSDVVVSAKYSAGGIVGAAHGSIKNATVRGSITSTSGYNTGGVAGYADTISHSEVQADINGIRNVGGLAGRASHITDSHFSGTVLAKENKVGGLVGELRSNGKIIKSYVTDSDIQAGGDSVGGLAGISERSSSTQFSYIDNQSEVRGATSVGGLIGHAASESNVVNSYALAQVRGNEKVGGLVGSSFNALSITHSYAAGLVHSSNSSSAGGLVGLSEVEKGKKRETLVLALNSYYDKDKTQQSKSVVGDAKSSSEMHKQKTFRRWDFDRIWRIDENNDYPRLRALTKGVVVINPEQPPSPEKPAPEPEPEKPVEEPKKPLSTVKAVDLSKTYDGKAVNTLGDLKKLQGWKGNGVTISGLQAGDTVANSFSGEVNFDGEKSNWKGAKDVKAGGYILDPRGLQSQKYEIQWGTGRLNIQPKTISLRGEKVYDGDTLVTPENSEIKFVGLVKGDNVSLSGEGRVKTANVLERNRLENNAFRLSTANYVIDAAHSYWKISQRPLFLIGSRHYTGNNRIHYDEVRVDPKGLAEKDKSALAKYLTFSNGFGQLDRSEVGIANIVSLGSLKLHSALSGNYKLVGGKVEIKSNYGPSKPVVPTTPSKPEKPAKPTKPAKPAEPAKPAPNTELKPKAPLKPHYSEAAKLSKPEAKSAFIGTNVVKNISKANAYSHFCSQYSHCLDINKDKYPVKTFPKSWANRSQQYKKDYNQGAYMFAVKNTHHSREDIANAAIDLRKFTEGEVDRMITNYIDKIPSDAKFWVGAGFGNSMIPNNYHSVGDYIKNVATYNAKMNALEKAKDIFNDLVDFSKKELSEKEFAKLNKDFERTVSAYETMLNSRKRPDFLTHFLDSVGNSALMVGGALEFGYNVSKLIPAFDVVHENIELIQQGVGVVTNAKDTIKNFLEDIDKDLKTHKTPFGDIKIDPEKQTQAVIDMYNEAPKLQKTALAVLGGDLRKVPELLESLDVIDGALDNFDLSVGFKEQREFLKGISEKAKSIKEKFDGMDQIRSIPDELLSATDKNVFLNLMLSDAFQETVDVFQSTIEFTGNIIGKAGESAAKIAKIGGAGNAFGKAGKEMAGFANDVINTGNSLYKHFDNINKRSDGISLRNKLMDIDHKHIQLHPITILAAGNMRDALVKVGEKYMDKEEFRK